MASVPHKNASANPARGRPHPTDSSGLPRLLRPRPCWPRETAACLAHLLRNDFLWLDQRLYLSWVALHVGAQPRLPCDVKTYPIALDVNLPNAFVDLRARSVRRAGVHRHLSFYRLNGKLPARRWRYRFVLAFGVRGPGGPCAPPFAVEHKARQYYCPFKGPLLS